MPCGVGGVNWVTVGQMTNSQGQLDNGKLLSKLHTVILRMDKNKTYRPPNVEAASDYLQQVIFVSNYVSSRNVIKYDVHVHVHACMKPELYSCMNSWAKLNFLGYQPCTVYWRMYISNCVGVQLLLCSFPFDLSLYARTIRTFR